MPSNKIKLSVIVLFYNGNKWIDSCVESLETQTLSRDLYEVILVDNGGSTPEVDSYKGKNGFKVIHFSENHGFADGNNRALEHAEGEIVLLMNQDAVILPNCLEELLGGFDEYADAGVISLNMLMISSGDDISEQGTIPGKTGLYRLSPFGYTTYQVIETDNDIVPVDVVSGNGLGFRKSVLEDIGGYLFDSRLGSYIEDLDFSMRLEKTAWKKYVRPGAVIYHYCDEAFSGKASHILGKLIHVSGNRLMVYYNNLKLFDFINKLPSLLLGIPLKVARMDGDRHINVFRPIVAMCILPIILLYFGLRVLSNIEDEQDLSCPAKKMRKSRIGWRISIQAGTLLFFCGIASLFLYKQDWKSIYLSAQFIDLPLMSLLVGLTIFVHIVTAVRTGQVFGRMGYNTSFFELFAISTSSQFSTVLTPAGVGTFISVPLLKRCFKIPIAYGTFFAVVDRLYGLYFLVCFTLVGFLGYIFNWDYFIIPGIPFLLIVQLIFFRVLHISDEVIHRFGVPEYGGELLNHLGNDYIVQSAIVASKLIFFGVMIFQYLIVTHALGYSISIVDAWMIISVSFMAGVASMIPMGLVARDALILALSSLVGIPADTGLIIIIIMRAVTSIPTGVLGTISGLWLGKKHYMKNNAN